MDRTEQDSGAAEISTLEPGEPSPSPDTTVAQPPAVELNDSQWAEVAAAADAAIEAIERLGAPRGQVSASNLPEILELHLKWLTSEGAVGRQADLSGAQLEGVDLTGANLRLAVLHNANLAGAELFMAQLQGAVLSQANLSRAGVLGASFHQADLQYANLTGTVGLTLDQLAGANLRGAVLPESICESDALNQLRVLSRRAAAFLSVIISVCALVCVRIFTVSDVELIRNAGAIPLPFLREFLPLTAFFLTAPVMLIGLSIALHLSLLRLWQAIAVTPAEFSTGATPRNCGPWFILALGFGQFAWLPARRTLLSHVESLITKVVAYWILAITLGAFWARYLTVHDLRGAILHSLLVAGAVALAIVLPGFNVSNLFARATGDGVPASLMERLRTFWRPVLALTAGATLALLSLGVIYGAPHRGTRTVNSSGYGVRTWAAGILWFFHFDPYANLAGHDVSRKPANWTGTDNSLDMVVGARMRSAHLPYANAYRGFFAKADLWNAQLDNADLSEADLRLADLHGSSLRFTVLNGARLFRTRLDKADLRGATLFSTDLGEANLSFALMSGANLERAKLDLASLYRADLQDAQLTEATLEGTDLREASLVRATLDRANLRNSYLSSAKLSGASFRRAQMNRADLTQADLRDADLRDANLQGAILANSDLTGARLQGADLRNASGLTAAGLCKAQIGSATQLDELMALQVDATCAQR